MGTDISLTRSQRLALIDLRNNATLSARTQLRLSSGRKINSVVDDAVNYFRAKSLSDNATDFANLRDGIGQAITHLEVTIEAIAGLEKLMAQLKGTLEAARSQSAAERRLANTALRNLGQQFVELTHDANYGGANLINNTGTGLTVLFGTRSNSKLDMPGLDFLKINDPTLGVFTITGLFGGDDTFDVERFIQGQVPDPAGGGGNIEAISLTQVGANNENLHVITDTITMLDTAIDRIRGHAQTLGANVAILQTREVFTDNYTTLNQVGSEKYLLADLNEEGANLVALQTRQQLGIQALSVAGQQQRAILTLLQ